MQIIYKKNVTKNNSLAQEKPMLSLLSLNLEGIFKSAFLFHYPTFK